VDPYATPDKPKLDPAAAYRTGLQQYARGDTAGALATFRSSLSSSPGFAPTWRGLGLVYEKLGNKSQARSAFKRYLQLAPTAGDADQIRDRMDRLGS
jgi:serine/threonine-protein kinase